MKVVSLIPARGGSKRVPRKNIKPLCGKPLIWYAIDASLRSLVWETWVSTEDPEIKKVAEDFKVQVLDRPEELAKDDISQERVMMHFTEHVDYDVMILVEPTYPLIQVRDINRAYNTFIRGDYDSLLTLINKKWFIWDIDKERRPMNYELDNRPNMQDFKGIYIEEGGIYVTTKKSFLKSKCRLSGKIGCYVLQHPSIDIDTEEDFKVAEAMINGLYDR